MRPRRLSGDPILSYKCSIECVPAVTHPQRRVEPRKADTADKTVMLQTNAPSPHLREGRSTRELHRR